METAWSSTEFHVLLGAIEHPPRPSWSRCQQVPLRLKRSLMVVVVDILADQVVDVSLAAQDEMIQALLPERLDEPLQVRLQVR